MKLGVIRDNYLNCTDMMSYQGIQREDFDVHALGKVTLPYVVNMTCLLYDNIKKLLPYYDAVDVVEVFNTWAQEVLAYHDNTFITVWDNLPFGKSGGYAGAMSYRAKKLLCRSAMAADTMIIEGVPHKKIEVVHAGVNTSIFYPPNLWYPKLRVLFAARIVPEKGLHTLITAMKGIDAQLVVCGTGDIEPYMDLASRTGVDLVYFGALPHEETAGLMRNCHIFCLPCLPVVNPTSSHGSWIEQAGVAATEAMATGLPAVVSNVGALPEYIDHGETGLLFAPGSWHELHSALKLLVDDSKLRTQMSVRARSQTAETHSHVVIGERLHEIYSGK